jgi:hypothetical protein
MDGAPERLVRVRRKGNSNGQIRGFWLRQNDERIQKQIPPLRYGMTNKRGQCQLPGLVVWGAALASFQKM